MIKTVMSFLRGYIDIEVRGAYPERFFNMCAQQEIAFWGIKRKSDEIICATLSTKGYFRAAAYAKKCMCRLKVAKKTGLAFSVRPFRKRYALIAGGIFCVALSWFLSSFLWTITITGCEELSPRDVLALMERSGLYAGAKLSGLDAEQIRLSAMMESDKLAFLAINLKGTHAEVIVKERIQAPEILPLDQPCDVISDKSGIVYRTRVLSGFSQVQVGQTLLAGEPIALGTVTSSQGEIRYVHSRAEVDLRTWKTINIAMSGEVWDGIPTGQVKTRYALVIGTYRFNLYFVENVPFACYYKTKDKQYLEAAGFRLPIGLIRERYTECEREQLQLDKEKCAAILKASAERLLAVQTGTAEVLASQFESEVSAGRIFGTLRAECLETAGYQVPIK